MTLTYIISFCFVLCVFYRQRVCFFNNHCVILFCILYAGMCGDFDANPENDEAVFVQNQDTSEYKENCPEEE